jgi:chromosome condensin MukBEF complex kleisin-like MukF subunit
MELHYIVGISCPCAFRFILRSFGGNGITNQGLNTRVNGAIGTTAASSLVTGFTDTMASPFEVYTITPLNNGLVNGGIFTDAPAPGNATKQPKH